MNRVMTMGELTASIAHEVNQPLAAIIASGDSCTAWLASEPPNLDKARAAASRMIQAATQASEIVQRVRALFKKIPSVATSVDMNELIEETISFVHHEAQRKNVSLRADLGAGLPTVDGDRVQLEQVILNLMMNGIESMAGLDRQPKQILIRSALPNPGELLVSVADTGPGIDAEHADRLFAPFFTTKPQGIGMGLADLPIDHRSARRPALGREERALWRCVPFHVAHQSTKRMSDPNCIVFVVDDDPLVRDSVADLLDSAGFAAQTFGSATEFIQAKRPDVSACLILDVELPDLSGLDLQTDLAKSGIEVPIIFLTGHGDIPKSVRAMKAGAVEFLTKPFRTEELLEAVGQALGRDGDVPQAKIGDLGTPRAARNADSTGASSPGARRCRLLKQTDCWRAWNHRIDHQSPSRPSYAQNERDLTRRPRTDGRKA